MIGLLTDFGLDDPYVGMMKSVILGIAPETTIVDLTHGIAPQDVASGAWALSVAFPYLPSDAVVVAVVDPGVGTNRRAVAVQIDHRVVIAPDNGLVTRVLPMALTPLAAVVLDNPDMWLRPEASATFHGRDVFAPVAARMMRSVPFEALGTAIDPDSLVRLSLPTPAHEGNRLEAHVIAIDHFGNLITDVGPDLVPLIFGAKRVSASLGHVGITARARTFGEGPANEPFWYVDSSGYAALAMRNANLARMLRVGVGMTIKVRLK